MQTQAAPGGSDTASPAGPAAARPAVASPNDQPHAAPAPRAATRQRLATAPRWEIAGIAVVLLLSAFLNLFRLDRLGDGNALYAAAVRSMMQDAHTFWFAGFDAGGFLAVDKPPVGLWTQVLFAKLFGFSGLAILLPQALAGIAGVPVVYGLVRRAHGAAAALLAGAALAVSPVSVTTQRNNTMDAQLVLALLLAAGAALRATEHATERGRLRWLLGAAALVGVGFEIKMLQAYLALPAIFGVYLLCAPARLVTRLAHLTLAGLVLLVVSFAWPLAVDLTPPDQRPFIASTTDNSELSLIFGANGLQRVLGRRPATGVPTPGAAGTAGATSTPAAAPAAPGAAPFGARSLPVGPTGRGGAGPGTANANGGPGPLRLVNPALGPLIGWLLPLAALGAVLGGALAWSTRGRRAFTRGPAGRFTPSVVLWTIWLAVMGAFFSVAGNFNNYYLITLAPAVAALAGIGVTTAWRAARGGRRWAWLLLPAVLLTAVAQSSAVHADPVEAAGWEWLVPLTWTGAALVAGATVYVLRRGGATFAIERPAATGAGAPAPMAALAAIGVAALLAGPAVWAGGPALHAGATAQAGAPAAQPAPAPPQPAAQSSQAATPAPSAAAGAPEGRNAAATQFAGATREALILQGPAAIATFQAARATQGAPQPGPSPTSPTPLPSSSPAVAGPQATRLAQVTQIAGATRAALIAQGPAAIATFQAGRAVQAAQATQAAQGAPPDTSSQSGAEAPPGQAGGSGPAALRFLVRYLTAHRGTARFLVAAPSALAASPFIIATGQPVMAYGGITGREQVITPAQFAERVTEGQVRYVAIGGVATPGSGSELSRWVTQNCAAIPAREWAGDGGTGGQTLYDCATPRTP